jgi:hypothetical protein
VSVDLHGSRGNPLPDSSSATSDWEAWYGAAIVRSACPPPLPRRTIILTALVLAALTIASPASAARYVSPSGSDAGSCTRSNPCRSFNKAYAVSRPGTVVIVFGGTYGGQRINARPKAHGPKILFRPARGASVTLHSIRVVRGSYITFRGFRVVDDTYNEPGAQRITYSFIKMRQFFVRGADHINYRNSEVGPNDTDDGMNWITAAYGTQNGASDIVLDRVRIHDFKKHNSGAHVDCIGIDDVKGLVIANSRFWNCEHFSIIFGKDLATGRAARQVLLQNNFFDCCYSGYYSLGFGDVEGPMRIRFNSFTLGVGWLGGTVRGLVFDSNVLSNNNSANCNDATWRYNVVARGSACGGRRAGTGFRSPPRDLHLRVGAAAVNYGNPRNHPRVDIDGQRRPGGRRPDAGADERH